jgi:hypothetical protein
VLSWEQVEAIVKRFSSLTPYAHRRSIPGSISSDRARHHGEDGTQRQLPVFAISAKRNARVTLDGTRAATIVKRSAHGLGHLCSTPFDPESGDRDWISAVWETIDACLKGQTREREWASRPAVSLISFPALPSSASSTTTTRTSLAGAVLFAQARPSEAGFVSTGACARVVPVLLWARWYSPATGPHSHGCETPSSVAR